MPASEQPSARFRSATEFPKTIDHLSLPEATVLYIEMRECLIFTNRSRAQLVRRNEEHKQSAIKLKSDVERLQGFIAQLSLEKEQLAASNQLIVSELEREINSMASHLNQLSDAFDKVADVENSSQLQWGMLSFPSRFMNFLRAVRAIVLFWRDERGDEGTALPSGQPQLPNSPMPEADAADRQERPQMHDDPASRGRSLLDR
jgi:hypothetical protein